MSLNSTMRFARTVRILHGALVAGVLTLGVLFFAIVRVRGPGPAAAAPIGAALAAVGLGAVVLAALVLRRRVPERRPDQAPDTYWASAEARGAAIVLWAVAEGGALTSLVGYFLTGALAPAVAAGIAIVTLVAFRPGRLESER